MIRKPALLLLLPVAVIALATTLAYLGRIPGGWFHAPWDKAAHAVLYGWLAACLAQTLPSRWLHWALTGPLLLAIFDEVTQSLARHRTADVWDLAADAVGIAVAYALLHQRYAGSREPA